MILNDVKDPSPTDPVNGSFVSVRMTCAPNHLTLFYNVAEPEDGGGIVVREAIEQVVVDALQRLGAPYELMAIDPAFADTAEFCAKYEIPADHAGNTIICASKKEPKTYCACLVLATTRLDVNHKVRGLMATSRVSFASGDETQALTGMMIGGVTLFGLPIDLPIYIDARVMALDYVILGSGSRSSKVKIAPTALHGLPNAMIVAGLSLSE